MCSRQRFTLAKNKSVYWNFPLAKALLSADRPRWEFLAAVSIDQRAAFYS